MKKKTSFFATILCLFYSLNSSAGLLLMYHQLALKDLDQMNDFVNSKIKESKKSSSGKIIPLREGLQAVFSRPNEDGMIAKVYVPLRNELDRHSSLEKSYKDLIDEALYALKNTKNFKADVQVSYAIFLENILSEFKPLAGEVGFERKMIEKIAQASVQLSKDALKERKRRLMKEGESPSVLAELVLKSADQEKKAREEKKSAEVVIDKTVVPGKEFDLENKPKENSNNEEPKK